MSDLDDEELIATRKLNGLNDNLYKNETMSEEAFNELIDNFEVVAYLTEYGRKGIKENVKKLQARIKELEEEKKTNLHKINSLEKENEDICTRVNSEYIKKENSISKQEIEDKIEKLKINSQQVYEEFLKSNRLDMDLHCRGIYTDAQIVILKELLEEKKQ